MHLGRPHTLTIESGHTLLLGGPVQFTIKSGHANCLGGELKNDLPITVEDYRQVPVFSSESTTVDLRTGSGGTSIDIAGSTIPADWTEAAQILQREEGVAVVVGEVDSGKSTLTAFLANQCLESGLSVDVIDGDVGQADIGPPATITASTIPEPIQGLHHAKPMSSYFVGETSPSRVPEKIVGLMARLRTEIEKTADVVIVNTDGWIGEPSALRYKHDLLDRLAPGLVFGLSRDVGLGQLLDTVPYTSMNLASSPYAKTRSKEDRKRNREVGYHRFLEGSRIVRESHDTAQLRMFDHPEQTLFRGDRRFRGFLVGLLDAHEKLLGIGRVREMRPEDWLLETRVEEQPSLVEIGNLLLSARYEEVGAGPLH